MKKYLADVQRWAALSLPLHGSPYILRFPFQFGDWCAPYGALPDWLKKGPWIGTAYFYHSSVIMSRIAAILGREKDAQYYEKLAEKIRAAFRKAFTDGSGRLKEEFQAGYVLALAFGLAEGGERRVMAERLWALIKENGVHLNSAGTVCVRTAPSWNPLSITTPTARWAISSIAGSPAWRPSSRGTAALR